jgi:hypothetical protein
MRIEMAHCCCPMLSFGIGGVEPSSSVTTVLV